MIDKNYNEFLKSNIIKWQMDNLGEDTTIVVIDEGFEEFPHMDYQVTVMDFGSDKNDGDTGHGSAVLSNGHEIAPQANIIYMPFNDVSYVEKNKMIDWIVDNKDDIDVISMSMNWSAVSGRKYFDRLEPLNIPFFVASGNDGDREDGVNYPASEPFAIAVGAYHDGTDSLARYSNGGKELDCVSYSGTHMYNSRGEIMSQVGTSFSTPFASFATLLYISWRKRNGLPKLTLQECKEFIKENAIDIKEEGFDNDSGWGLFALPNEVPKLDFAEGDDNVKFKDTEQHWAKDYIEFVADKGFMKGYEDGSFQPNKPISRAEVAVIIARLNGFQEKK